MKIGARLGATFDRMYGRPWSLAACLRWFLLVDSRGVVPWRPQAPPAIVQPGAPGQASRVIGAVAAADLSKVGFTPADVRFMQGMIGHHAQALEMTAIVRSRSGSEAIQQLALRIELSQADEIKMMQEWLTARGQPLPDPHAHHAAGAALMPGMLTPAEMAGSPARAGPSSIGCSCSS